MYPSLPIDSIVSGYREAMDWLHEATSRNVAVMVPPARTGCPNHSGYDFINKRAHNVYNTNNPYSTSGVTVISGLGISGILNIPFSGGLKCPVCNGQGDIFAPTSGVVKARVKWTSEDTDQTIGAGDALQKGKLIQGDVRLKVTGAADIALLDNAKNILVDGILCAPIRSKIPVGLREPHTYIYHYNKTT